MSRLLFLCCGLVCSGCANRMFYHPDRWIRETPDRRGLEMEEVSFEAEDGVRLTGWWLPAVGEARGTVVHFHGNAQNMSTHVRFAEWLPGEGYHLFVFDYRGYGRSEGTPDRAGVVRDAVAALEYAAGRPETEETGLLVWGQSLGGTAALQGLMRSEVSARGVLVDSAYYSHASIAADKMRELPWYLRWLGAFRPLLVTSGYDAHTALRELKDTPTAFLHGGEDSVIPPRHSERLYEVAPKGRALWIIPGAEHCDAVLRFPERVRPKILGFFADPERE